MLMLWRPALRAEGGGHSVNAIWGVGHSIQVIWGGESYGGNDADAVMGGGGGGQTEGHKGGGGGVAHTRRG